MKVTQVAIRPSEESATRGRPSLTPELLAACGARYSRNNEGLEAILGKIDPDNLDKSVDSIFRMLDYGHQSIADMVPVAMFIDGVSIWLAYLIWTLTPTASGQESSTRYIRLDSSSLVDDSLVSQDPGEVAEWRELMAQSFRAYEQALDLWTSVAEQDPSVMRIPESLLRDTSGKAIRQVERMRRNYAFDRARYFLPAAAKTNLMLMMSARGWVQLIQQLLSHPLLEANHLGELLREELALAAPRMMKYAKASDAIRRGLAYEHERLSAAAATFLASIEDGSVIFGEASAEAKLAVLPPDGVSETELVAALSNHENRYSWTGWDLARTVVRFSWNAVALAEIRDLNRHRTGTKYCPPLPRGFYCAADQLPSLIDAPEPTSTMLLSTLAEVGRSLCIASLSQQSRSNAAHIYYAPLGMQFMFEHATTGDKFIYEAELRTGIGAHFRYATHLHDLLSLWYFQYPGTRTFIWEGHSEPE
jgi:thymidylate synthase ThyX